MLPHGVSASGPQNNCDERVRSERWAYAKGFSHSRPSIAGRSTSLTLRGEAESIELRSTAMPLPHLPG